MDLWALMARSSAAVVAVLQTAERELENLSVVAVLEKGDFAMEATVVAVEFVAAAEDGAPEPYSAVPILSLRLASYRHPSQQTPWESCMVECPRSRRFATCPVRSFSAPSEALLVSSSLPLASSCPLRL